MGGLSGGSKEVCSGSEPQPSQFPGRFTGGKSGDVLRGEHGMTCVKSGGATGSFLTVSLSLGPRERRGFGFTTDF